MPQTLSYHHGMVSDKGWSEHSFLNKLFHDYRILVQLKQIISTKVISVVVGEIISSCLTIHECLTRSLTHPLVIKNEVSIKRSICDSHTECSPNLPNLSQLPRFYSPWYHQETYGLLLISRGIEVNYFAQIRLMLALKFGTS